MRRLIFGGTFDPIHNAHLAIAQDCAQLVEADYIHYLPCYQPVHRSAPQATTAQRVQMLKLAIQEQKNALIDSSEIERGGDSYMVDTLTHLSQDYMGDSLILLMGGDSLLNLHHWKRWQHLLDHAHIIVAKRPGIEKALNTEVQTWFNQHQAHNVNELKQSCYGKILAVEVAMIPLSASLVRARLAKGEHLEGAVPAQVLQYIEKNQIYSL